MNDTAYGVGVYGEDLCIPYGSVDENGILDLEVSANE